MDCICHVLGQKHFGILHSGCVILECVFSSVCFSEREMSYPENHPVITHLRDTKAKKQEREITRGARLLCEGLQIQQLPVSGVSLSLLSTNTCINLLCPPSAKAKGIYFAIAQAELWKIKNKKTHKACDTCR